MKGQHFDEITQWFAARPSRRRMLTGVAGSILATLAHRSPAKAICPIDPRDCIPDSIWDLPCLAATGGLLDCDGAGVLIDGVEYTVEKVGDGAEYVLRGPGGAFAETAAMLTFLGIPLDPATLIIASEGINRVSTYRALNQAEERAAKQVFGSSLPPRETILLTNIPHIQEAWREPRPYVWKNLVTGQYVVNLGGIYAHPMSTEAEPDEWTNRSILMHELTHVWQIYHAESFFGWACDVLTRRSYDLEIGTDWARLTKEGQGMVVQTWEYSCNCPGCESTLCDRLRPYIERNIRRGDPYASYPE
jgi:hypothetical protein